MTFRSIILASSLLMATGASQASLVTNGGFESALSGWSCVVSDGNCGTGAFFGAPEGASHFFGFQNSAPAGELSQALATVAGASYSISFQYTSLTDEPSNTLAVEVGDLSEVLDVQVSVWKSYSGTFTAAAALTDLSFLFRTVGGSGTLGIDAVVVDRAGAVPLPASWTLALLALGLAGVARRTKA